MNAKEVLEIICATKHARMIFNQLIHELNLYDARLERVIRYSIQHGLTSAFFQSPRKVRVLGEAIKQKVGVVNEVNMRNLKARL